MLAVVTTDPMCGETTVDSLVGAVGHALAKRGLKLVTAESCTGGWLAKAVTDLVGSSAWFDRGFVTYSNESKTELLGVRSEILNAHGAVSAETARAMAEGALRRSGADIAVAITGVAGPDGGSIDTPVGTVWIAWCRHHTRTLTAHYLFEGDREAVRYRSVGAALEGILRLER